MDQIITSPPKDFSYLLQWVDRADVEMTRLKMKPRITKRQVYNIIKGRQTNWRFIQLLANRALKNSTLISKTQTLPSL